MFQYYKLFPGIIARQPALKYLPLHLQVETTTACNLNCNPCPRKKVIKTPKSMDFYTFKYIYDQIKPIRINLSGLGEPLMNKDIFKISSYSYKNGSVVNFPTNFTFADLYLDEIILSGISQLKVSIDAASKEGYIKVRKVDKFEQIVQSIKKINSIKSTRGITTPEIRFNFAIQKENYEALIDLIHLANKLMVNVIYFQNLLFIGMDDMKEEVIGSLNIESLYEILVIAAKVAKKKRIKTNLGIWIRDFASYTDRIKIGDSFFPPKRHCYFPWFSAYIDVNGDVKPCCSFQHTPDEGRMGNVLNKRFEDIWNNGSYQEARRAINRKDPAFTVCKNCIPESVVNLFHISRKMLPHMTQGIKEPIITK